MKNHIQSLVLVLLFVNTCSAQNKLLTIEDALNKSKTTLAPKKLQQLNWIKNTHEFYYVDKQELYKVDANHATIIKPVVSRTQLNQQLKTFTKDSLVNFPTIEWKDLTAFTFTQSDSIYNFNLLTQQLVLSIEKVLPNDAENIDKCEVNGFTAYTKLNNLYLWENGKEQAVTTIKELD